MSSEKCNGKRPNIVIYDELDDLRRLYTPAQIKKMWEDAYPKENIK